MEPPGSGPGPRRIPQGGRGGPSGPSGAMEQLGGGPGRGPFPRQPSGTSCIRTIKPCLRDPLLRFLQLACNIPGGHQLDQLQRFCRSLCASFPVLPLCLLLSLIGMHSGLAQREVLI